MGPPFIPTAPRMPTSDAAVRQWGGFPTYVWQPATEHTMAGWVRCRRPRVSADELYDPDFTGGLRSEEYLRRLRAGEV
jgi:hypothetical protein